MSDRAADEQSTTDGADPDVPARAADDLSAIVSLTGDFYRGEIDRVTTWRTRLDQTTNWAVVVMAAILTWAFSSTNHPHYVVLIGGLTIGVFLFVEAQRYQEYDAWRARVRLVQQDFLAVAYHPNGPEHRDWREQLSDDLREPRLRISIWRAIGHRLRRIYYPLLTVLFAAWALRVTVFATGESWRQTAAIGTVSGPVVVAIVGGTYVLLTAVTVLSRGSSAKREFDRETETGSLKTDD